MVYNMKHIFSKNKHFFSKALSQESAVVLLAFISTTLVFGFIIYNYVSTVPDYREIKVAASSILLYYDNGYVWKIVVPLQVIGDNVVDFRPSEVKVSLSMGDGFSADFINISGTDAYDVYDNIIILGDLGKSIQSCIIHVGYYNGSDSRTIPVNLHVYFDEHGKLHIVVDDDNDGLIDSTYLIAFVEGAEASISLDLNSVYILSVEKNSVLPLSFLKYILALSVKPNAQIRVATIGGKYYTINLQDIARSLREPVILTSIMGGNDNYQLDPGETGSIIILLPDLLELGRNDKITLSIYLSKTSPIGGEISIPQDLRGVGLLVLSGLKSSEGR